MYQVESIVNVFYCHVLALRPEGGKDDIWGPVMLARDVVASQGRETYLDYRELVKCTRSRTP